jgi:hypothetical protein
MIRSVRRSAILLFTVAGMIPEAATSSGEPAGIQRMSDLTHSALAPVSVTAPRSPVQPFRGQAFEILLLGLRIAYPGSLIALVACMGWATLPRHRSVPAIQMAGGALLLIGSLGAWCLLIAVFDVLAVPPPVPSGYNRLGYARLISPRAR